MHLLFRTIQSKTLIIIRIVFSWTRQHTSYYNIVSSSYPPTVAEALLAEALSAEVLSAEALLVEALLALVLLSKQQFTCSYYDR